MNSHSHSHKRRLDNFLHGISRSASSAKSAALVAAPALTSAVATTTTTTTTTTPTATATATTESQSLITKRQRLGASTASYINRSNTSSVSDAAALKQWNSHAAAANGIRNITTSSSATTTTTASARLPDARYCPADRDQLLARLSTFQELTGWAPKPERASEVEWAKKGWTCQGKERVKCGVCKKELVVGLNRKKVDGKETSVLVASEIENALVEKYVELMVTSHQEDCPWRRHGCDDSLLRLPLGNPRDATASLRQRYVELVERKDYLPYEFNLRLPAKMDVDALISQLPAEFFTLDTTSVPDDRSTETSPLPANRVALALAMAGWQALANPRPAAIRNTLSCRTCLRRLGLWMFKSKEVGPDGTIVNPAPMDHLDPVQEHRFFCPWRSAVAQRAAVSAASTASSPDMDMAGWERLALVVRNEASIRSVMEGKTSKRRTFLGLVRSAPSTPARGNQATATTATAVATDAGPVTPVAGGAAGDVSNLPAITTTTPTNGGGGYNNNTEDNDYDDESVRDAKEKAMYSRLRRIKSLFHSKGSRRHKSTSRASSRPGTSHSLSGVTPGEGGGDGLGEEGTIASRQ